MIDEAAPLPVDGQDARGVHAVRIDREGHVRIGPEPDPAIDRALALRRLHHHDILQRIGLEAAEVDLGVEPGMDRGDVIALDEIVGIGLPVAGDLELDLLQAGEALHRIRLGQLRQRAQAVGQRLGLEIEIDEEQPAPFADLDRQQRIILLVEPGGLAEGRRGPQPPVGAIDPAVVFAAQHLAMARAVIHEMPGTVAAEIVEAPQGPLAIADDEDAPARDLGGDVIAGIRQLRDRPQELPFPGKDLAPLALEDVGPVIPAGGDGELGLRLDGIIHGRILRRGRGFAKGVRQLWRFNSPARRSGPRSAGAAGCPRASAAGASARRPWRPPCRHGPRR